MKKTLLFDLLKEYQAAYPDFKKEQK